MPKKKEKPAFELTTEEAMAKLFPKEVIEAAKKIAHERDTAGEKPRKSPHKSV